MKRKSILSGLLLLCILTLVSAALQGQTVQNIKGRVIDKDSELPLIGATVALLSSDSNIGTTTDINGNYVLEGIQTGRHEIKVSYLGYREVSVPNILLTSGKEVVVDVALEEALVGLDEVVVTAESDKDNTINEMASISARTFSVEEVTRYSGGRNDVSRLVANFAGVSSTNDNRNDIVVRGNSPAGILWRMEGVPIPNPNHFSTLGTTGGPVSALNTNLLKNSDFMTSAFPAEYGNAIAGVFDVGLRSGNKDKFEITAQLAAFSGLEAMVEGPMGNQNSFLVSYRYSFVQLADVFGLNFGTNAIPNYQDISFNFDFGQTKIGKFNIFGIGGKSDIEFLASEVDENDLFSASDADSKATSKFGVLGIKHSYLFNQKSYLKSTISISGNANTFNEFRYSDSTFAENYPYTNVDDQVLRFALHTYINTKFNAKLTTRMGITLDNQNVQSIVRDREEGVDIDNDGLPDFRTLRSIDGDVFNFQPYVTAKYKFNQKLNVVGGLHGQVQTLNTKTAIEPRIGLNYSATNKLTFNLGYGLHSQLQPLPVFFNLGLDETGAYTTTNADLDFTKSHHFVAGFDYVLGDNWRLNAETYYQHLFNAPVEKFPSSFSLLNAGADFVFPSNTSLVNDGKGRNYGVELTIEKFFSRGYYGLFTGSLFQSKYKGSDGIERNTAFNNEYIANVLGGKEWTVGKKYAITTDFKLTFAGGRFITPVDLEASRILQDEVLKVEEAFSNKLSPYFRLDFKIGYRMNLKGFSQQFFLDFQNITNHKNVFTKRYNRQTNEVNTVYQIGFFPDVLWRIQF